jgi:hypothetical protein
MDRRQDHIEGYRRAAKDAVEFVESYARKMNDPSAKAAVNVCADRLGTFLKRMTAPSERDPA